MISIPAAFLLSLLVTAGFETVDAGRISSKKLKSRTQELGADKVESDGETKQAEDGAAESKEEQEEEATKKAQPHNKMTKQSAANKALKHLKTLPEAPRPIPGTRPAASSAPGWSPFGSPLGVGGVQASPAGDHTAPPMPIMNIGEAWGQPSSESIEAKRCNHKGALLEYVSKVVGRPLSGDDVVYTLTSSPPGSFQATVKIEAIDGMEFQTAPQTTKRDAEQRAAQLALLSYQAKYPGLAEEAKKQRREARLAIKLEAKCTRAIALLATLREKLSAASVDRPIVIIALDVEAWEEDGKKVTEIGLAIAHLSFVDTSPIQMLESSISFRHRHILIREHLAMYNGFVANNKDYFIFGDSEVFALADAVKELTVELNSADFIVGHAFSSGCKWLREIGVNGLEADPLSLQSRLVDTQTLAFSMPGVTFKGLGPQPQLGLRVMAEGFGLNPDRLHNAANDAAFTLQVMLSQCGVIFPLPQRTMSKHQSMPEFQTALAEAKMLLNAQRLSADGAAAGNRQQRRHQRHRFRHLI